VGVVSAGEFSKDSRLAILELTGADMAMTEYIVCLAERQDLRLVRSFLDLVR
jgi:Na+-transporting NADH:ubiquinone oxidoreductase subunit NqrA